jgi:hypothetical protein
MYNINFEGSKDSLIARWAQVLVTRLGLNHSEVQESALSGWNASYQCGMQSAFLGRVDIQPIVVEKQDFISFALQGVSHVLKRILVRLDLARQVRSEVVVESLL